MSRINTNVSSLNAQNRLNRTNLDLQTSLTRLSTGLRINSGKDDPAGLIASEVLRSDITSINKALSNTQRANQIIGTADSALGQVSSLLNDVRGLVTEAANRGALSDDEIAANQLQIDSSLEAINRIAQTTTFQGRRLLDGSLDFQVSQGTNFANVRDLEITSANLGATGSIGVNIDITQAATRATVTSNVPAAGASAKASATVEFAATTAGAEAAGTINLANSFIPSAQATGTVALNAAVAKSASSGTLTLDGGASLKIAAQTSGALNGTLGDSVKINVTTVSSGSTTATYDATSKTLNLTLLEGSTGSAVVTALSGVSAVNSLFAFSDGSGTVASGDAGLRTGVLSGGTDYSLSGSKLGASGTGIVLGAGGLKLDIAAVAGGVVGGKLGNSVNIEYQYGTSAAGAVYTAGTNTLKLTIDTGASVSANIAAFAASAGVTGNFTFANNNSGTLGGTTTGTLNNQLSGGFEATQFQLTAVAGGKADGQAGNNVTLNYTASASGLTTANYNTTSNKLEIQVGTNATLNDIASAINSTNAFVVSNLQNGTARFTSGGTAPTINGGNQTTAASSFRLQARDGGLADGGVGNTTQIQFQTSTDGATTASYNQSTNKLVINVAAGAKISDITSAITAGAGTVFEVVANSTVNGNARFSTSDNATLATPLQGGSTNATGARDRLVVTATANGIGANTKTVTFQEDASITTGTPVVSVTNGDIVVRVSSTVNTKLSDIAAMIGSSTGGAYTASISPDSNGEGVYKPLTQAPPAAGTLTGGQAGRVLADDLTFQLTGGSGSEVFKFQRGATIDSVIQSVNLLSDSTGITASLNSTTSKLEFTSVQFGSEGVVGVEVIKEGTAGTFASTLSSTRAVGTDVQASVNGTAATGKGNRITLNTATLSFSMNVAEGSNGAIGFTITGGGAQFQLGPDVVSNQQARLGISSLNTAKIGGVSGKLLELSSSGSSSLTKDVTRASRIVDEVINKVTTLRGRLGAFQRTALDSNTASLNDTLTNLNEAQSSIRDADFAKESANLTRAQILVQSGTSVLGIANQSSQSVLSLLR